MNIGETIKNERTKIGISQAKLGELLQVTQQAVGKWEKSIAEPDSQALLKMADLFGVTVDYLIGHDALNQKERAAGLTETKKISITPIEGEMLTMFREIGKKYGEDAQRSIILMAENMLKLK